MERFELWINGVSSQQYGVEVTSELRLSAPVPRVETIDVAGRNGTLHISDGTFENRTASVDCYVYDDRNVKEKVAAVQGWLLSGKGYARLIHSGDVEHYLMGRVKNGVEIATRLNKLQPFTIEFDCMPQRFLNQDFAPIIITKSGQTFLNPTQYTAFPLFKINKDYVGYQTKTIKIGSKETTFGFGYQYSYVYYDADLHMVYYDPQTYSSDSYLVADSDVLSVGGGENTIEFDNTFIPSIEIYPRWWEL